MGEQETLEAELSTSPLVLDEAEIEEKVIPEEVCVLDRSKLEAGDSGRIKN